MASVEDLRWAGEEFIRRSDTYLGLDTLGGYAVKQDLYRSISVTQGERTIDFGDWVEGIVFTTNTSTNQKEIADLIIYATAAFPRLMRESNRMQVAIPVAPLSVGLNFKNGVLDG